MVHLVQSVSNESVHRLERPVLVTTMLSLHPLSTQASLLMISVISGCVRGDPAHVQLCTLCHYSFIVTAYRSCIFSCLLTFPFTTGEIIHDVNTYLAI